MHRFLLPVASSWHFTLFHDEDAQSNNPQISCTYIYINPAKASVADNRSQTDRRTDVNTWSPCKFFSLLHKGAGGGALGWGSALLVRRSLMEDLILSGRTMHLASTRFLMEMSNRSACLGDYLATSMCPFTGLAGSLNLLQPVQACTGWFTFISFFKTHEKLNIILAT